MRENLMRYTGVATVFDARIVCLRPELVTGTISAGSIDMTLKLPPVRDIISGLTTTNKEFNVSVPRIDRLDTLAWTILPLSNSVGGMVSSLDPASRQNTTLSYESYINSKNPRPSRYYDKVSPDGVWRTSDELACGVDVGNAYVIMDSIQAVPVEADKQYVVSEKVDETRGPSTGTGTFNTLPVDYSTGSMSVCFDALPKSFLYHQIQDFEIIASGPGNMSEPQTTFRSETQPDDIPALRTQLAATDESRALDMISRGLLNLTSADAIETMVDDALKDWEEYCVKSSELDKFNRDTTPENYRQYPPNIYNSTTFPWLSQLALYEPNAIDMCGGPCRRRVDDGSQVRAGTPMAVVMIHMLQGHDMLKSQSPAIALQTVLTQLLREVYYTWMIQFDSESDVRMVPSVPVQVPAGHLGFSVVMSIILLHLSLCMTACLAFVRFTYSTRLGNAWQAVADIARHEDGKRFIDQMGQLDDAELNEKLIAEAAQGRTFVIRQRQ